MSLRDDLARKRARRVEVKFALGAEGARAEADLGEARQALQFAQLTGNADAITKAKNWISRAERTFEKHSMRIVIRGLDEEARDALASAHPATAEQMAEDSAMIKAKKMSADDRRTLNKETWLPAALALTVVDSDITEEEWAAELADDQKWAAGEKQALFVAIVSATNEGPAPGIPKD
jgi:hypothetical protein